jgi:lysylphosphatidylglycerol synthetase-like protein (DUF2156 family)
VADKSSGKGGVIPLLVVLAFMGVTNGIVYLGSGELLTSSGVGWSCATGFAGFLVAWMVAGLTGKIAAATQNAGLRWLAPVIVFVGAAALTWFLVIPMMHRSGDSFGYQGTYQVTYSDGHTAAVEASVLNHQEWSKWMGGYIGVTIALFLAGVWQVRNRLRKEVAPGPETGPTT